MRRYFIRNTAIAAIAGALVSTVTAARASNIAEINFDTGYNGGESYSASTGIDTGVVAPASNGILNKPTKIESAGGTATWTATVADNGTGTNNNWLRFDIAANSAFEGVMEAFAPGSASATNTGRVHFSFDYTRLTTGGGPLMFFRGIDNNGAIFTQRLLYLDAFVGDVVVPFTVGQAYNIDTAIDLDQHTYEIYLNGLVVVQGSTMTQGGSFSGFNFGFFNNETQPTDRSFAIDNIIVGTIEVPEPTSAGILALGAITVVVSRRRA